MKKERDSVDEVGHLFGKMMAELKCIEDQTWRNASAIAVISIIVSEIPGIIPDLLEIFGGEANE